MQPTNPGPSEFTAQCNEVDKRAFMELTKGEPLLQWFEWWHLPATLQEVSRPFTELALHLVNELPSNPSRTKALNALVEAKDWVVRSKICRLQYESRQQGGWSK